VLAEDDTDETIAGLDRTGRCYRFSCFRPPGKLSIALTAQSPTIPPVVVRSQFARRPQTSMSPGSEQALSPHLRLALTGDSGNRHERWMRLVVRSRDDDGAWLRWRAAHQHAQGLSVGGGGPHFPPDPRHWMRPWLWAKSDRLWLSCQEPKVIIGQVPGKALEKERAWSR